jgi:hypothetical protein
MKIEVVAATPKIEETPLVVGGVYEEKDANIRWLVVKDGFSDKYVLVNLSVNVAWSKQTLDDVTANLAEMRYIPDAVLRIPANGGER